MKMIYIAILSCFISVFTGCNKDNIEKVSTDFPMSVGSHWNYQLYDSLQYKYDTVSVKVVSSVIKSNHTVFTWQFSNGKNSISDSLYVVDSSFSISFYNDSSLSDLKWQFKLPFKVGESWTINENDNYKVVSNEKVDIYPNTFKINRDLQSFNYILKENIWIADNIGIVKMDIYEFNLGPAKNQTWHLLSYYSK